MSNEQLINDLKHLLIQGGRTTQHMLCSALAEKGHSVNQPKISRFLKKINAIKLKNEDGEMVYRLPHDMAPPSIASEVSRLVINIVHNETTILIKTSPGSASLIARIIDNKKCKILGTLAGDDTIFVAPLSIKTIAESFSLVCACLAFEEG